MKNLEMLKNMVISSVDLVNLLCEMPMNHGITKAQEFKSVGTIATGRDGSSIVELSHFSRYRYEREAGSWGEKDGIRVDHSFWKFEAKDEFRVDGNFPRCDDFNGSFYSNLLLDVINLNKHLYFSGLHDEDWILLDTGAGVLKNNPITDLFFYDQYSFSLYINGQCDGFDENGNAITGEEKIAKIKNMSDKSKFRCAFDLAKTPY